MKISAQDFLKAPQKSITLLGMSGAGKTYITSMLDGFGWESYSCDYMIGSKYLKSELEAVSQSGITAQNISALSAFIGKIGDESKGGFAQGMFRDRQQAYYDAECQAIAQALIIANRAKGHFVHDSTGSLCEIEDHDLIRKIGERTLFVYLKTSAEDEKLVLQRAQDYPKPLFFPAAFLEEALSTYMEEQNLKCVAQITPDDFARWVFPRLFTARKPKYQYLADSFGVTIPSSAFHGVTVEQDFINIIVQHLDI